MVFPMANTSSRRGTVRSSSSTSSSVVHVRLLWCLVLTLALMFVYCVVELNENDWIRKQQSTNLLSSLSSSSTSSQQQQQQQQQQPFINDLLKRLNYRGTVDASRGGSRVHDLFRPDHEAVLFGGGRTHADKHVVIDVGAFDGMDLAYPAYQQGYTVVAFELARETQRNIIQNWKHQGLQQGTHFTVVHVDQLVDQIANSTTHKEQPYLTQYLPLQQQDNNKDMRLYLVCAGASDQTRRVQVTGQGTTAQAQTADAGNDFLMELDRLIAPDTPVFLLKTDAEGHDGKALQGARRLLQRTSSSSVYSVLLEFRPRSLREHGSDPLELLQWLWHDCQMQCYDMNSHPGYQPVAPYRGGLARPSDLEGFVKWLDAVPIGKGPAGDALGGWEDLMCIPRL